MQSNHSPDEAGLYSNGEKFSDKVTKRKIEKHLSDINDIISEEDIKNVKTDVTVIENPTDERVEDEEVNDAGPPEVEEENKEENESFPMVTPWKVLEP